jgi:NADPH:quinone reductase-like Zn-dependent oxidoreductase
MKAAVVHQFGQAPRCESFEFPSGASGIPVQVLAAALSPRVRSSASGEHYRSLGKLPLVPGVDGVGIEPGGQRVYFLAASEPLGTMAERTLADPLLMTPLPDGVGSSTIAAGMLPAISAWIALTRRVALRAGQRVLVLGATGTSGQLAVQIARHFGASGIIAAGRDPHALEHTRSLGATEAVALSSDPTAIDAIAQAASEVDIVLDYLWGNVATALMPALCRRREAESRALHWISIGSVAGDEITLPSALLRKRNLHILGSGQGATSTAEMFSAAPEIIAAFATGTLAVNVREAPLAAVESLWSSRAPAGERLVFIP